MSNKNDPKLGQEVKQYLISMGVESPVDYDVYCSTTSQEKVDLITDRMTDILQTIGFDLSNPSVEDTPKRVAKMWVNEVMTGLDYDNFPRIMTFPNEFNTTGMVVERGVTSMSLCSHHLVTIDGTATIAYIPKDKVPGISKIARVVDFFSRRPQEAERLTLQIYYALQYVLETDDIAVFLDGVHYCMKSRGVKDANASTSTVKLGGDFLNDPAVRQEFYGIVNSSTK